MAATALDILMILSLGILGGTGTGLLIGFLAGRQRAGWSAMAPADRRANLLLVLACSVAIAAFLAWYLYEYSAA